MGKIVERRKKKKGRPSLLDLQKRSIKELQLLGLSDKQRHEDTKFLNNYDNLSSSIPSLANCKSETSNPSYRSSRRNSAHLDGDENDGGLSGEIDEEGEEADGNEQEEEGDDDEDEDDDEGDGGRREKKFKLVVKLPQNEFSDPNLCLNPSLIMGDDESTIPSRRKRNIEAIGDGSGFKIDPTSVKNNAQEQKPTTLLPHKKLLFFILDRLQKKDTYGVFSEPVDPEELPDYHEVIEHPMDFGTIRKKLSDGVYTILQQFESDVFLICSNAMRYNSSDTVYFRQARSIQELAKKDFENLRQDSDGCEPEPKVVRRGRPPTRNLKKAIQRLSLDRARSEHFSDASLASALEKTIISRHDSLERNDEASAPFFKGMKQIKRLATPDENRRNTYNQFCASSLPRGSSVLTTFDMERKQLMAVGLMSEHGYGRSLARFAASIGPVAWKVASMKIKRSLPSEVEFGPGWVGEDDLPPSNPSFPISPSSAEMVASWPSSLPSDSSQSQNCLAMEDGHSSEREDQKPKPFDGFVSNRYHQPPVWRPEMNGTYEHSTHPALTPEERRPPAIDQELQKIENSDSVSPDPNVRFQGQGSTRPDPVQPDLALQL